MPLIKQLLCLGVLNACFAVLTLANDGLYARIDALIEGVNGGAPIAVCDDATFFRRAHLDFAGVIPSAEALRAFLVDDAVDKRETVLDHLLNSPEYAPTMRDRFDVHFMERRGEDATWRAWLEAAFAENKSWADMTREMVRADLRDEANRGAAYFYAKRLEKYGANPTDYPGLTRDVGRLLLGKDLQCAECHNHRSIKAYDQIDFQGLLAALGKLKLIPGDIPMVEEQLTTEKLTYASVFTGKEREVGPRIPGLPEIELVIHSEEEQYLQKPDRKTKTLGIPRFSPLEKFSEQITDAPGFSSNIVNRVWFMMMGRGLVEPLDQFHPGNPASHPAVLRLLATEFRSHDYDLKWLFRELARSRVYQRAGIAPEAANDVFAADHFRVAIERRLSAEQLLASTLQALQVKQEDAPLDDVKPAEEDGEKYIGLRARFMAAFAGEAREPEYAFSPGLKSALFVLNDEEFAKLLVRDDALPAQLAGKQDDAQIAEALCLNVYSRWPLEAEVRDIVSFLKAAGDERRTALADIVWAMLTSTEFVVNH